jgi:hypothetical protein
MTRRRDVFAALVSASDVADGKTTTVTSLAMATGADPDAVEAHVSSLVDCDLALRAPSGRVRVTAAGEAMAELDIDEGIVVSPPEDEQ